MEVNKLGKIIENHNIEIQLALRQLKEARDELQHSLQKRKDIVIQQNDTQYQEDDTIGLFEDGNSSEFDVGIADLMEKNNALTKEVKNIENIRQARLLRGEG